MCNRENYAKRRTVLNSINAVKKRERERERGEGERERESRNENVKSEEEWLSLLLL
jgi:hypothetical protein